MKLHAKIIPLASLSLLWPHGCYHYGELSHHWERRSPISRPAGPDWSAGNSRTAQPGNILSVRRHQDSQLAVMQSPSLSSPHQAPLSSAVLFTCKYCTASRETANIASLVIPPGGAPARIELSSSSSSRPSEQDRNIDLVGWKSSSVYWRVGNIQWNSAQTPSKSNLLKVRSDEK